MSAPLICLRQSVSVLVWRVVSASWLALEPESDYSYHQSQFGPVMALGLTPADSELALEPNSVLSDSDHSADQNCRGSEHLSSEWLLSQYLASLTIIVLLLWCVRRPAEVRS